MTFTNPKHLGALVLMAVFAIGACSGGGGATAAPATDGGGDLTGTVTNDGSSTVYPITEAVAEEFQIANPGVQAPSSLSGTGGGFQKFCRGETDTNGASRPIKIDDEAEGVACEANGVEWVELQVAIDGLSVIVHPDNAFATCLTVDELNAIFGPDAPETLLWSDVRSDFPATEVNRFMPGADSGTFDYFSEEISGDTGAATRYATQSEDDNTLVTGVAGDVNAIGYFGYAYFVENEDKLKAVEVDGGDGCVAPTPETINGGTYTPLSRPLFIYPDVGKARERPELKGFIDFYLANTNELAAEVGYIAMPDDLLAAEIAEWEDAVGN